MSEIVKCVINPETKRVGFRTYPGGGIELIFLIAGSIYCSIVVDPAELSDATWREFFKANPEITPALAEAKGKSIEWLGRQALLSGFDLKGSKHNRAYFQAALNDINNVDSFFVTNYEKITVSLPEPKPGAIKALQAALDCAEKPESIPDWKHTAYEYREEAKRLKAALAAVQAAVGDVLDKQEAVKGD